MKRADAIAAATRAVLAPQLDDLRKGKGTLRIDAEGREIRSAEDWLADQARRRQREIIAEAERLMHPPAAKRCHCGAVATTQIGADHFCDDHAATARRLPLPFNVAVAS